MNPYKELADAIIVQAVNDYRLAVKKVSRNPDNEKAWDTIEEIEEFFKSDWFDTLSSINPDHIIKELRQESYEIIKEGRHDSKRVSTAIYKCR